MFTDCTLLTQICRRPRAACGYLVLDVYDNHLPHNSSIMKHLTKNILLKITILLICKKIQMHAAVSLELILYYIQIYFFCALFTPKPTTILLPNIWLDQQEHLLSLT